MNITELARQLKITPQELRNNLPRFGYDIGQKAIKINRNVANKIIRDWPRLRRQLEAEKEKELREAEAKKKEERAQVKVKVPSAVTVKDFAALAGEPVNTVLSALMKSGVFVSLNERIDYDTAWLVGSELGITVEPDEKQAAADSGADKGSLKDILAKEDDKELLDRPPVIVVMGHVDHGKTKLLDAVRKTNVVEGEAGGITQHIGAYQVVRKNQPLTFIDTPGHEAFTAMRSRGARIADIAILVVAADDGVKPQTVEAYRIIEAAKVPFVVAINKIDKPDANQDKVKQELSQKLNLVPEDWGGRTVCVPISALEGTGINDLLDMVLLLAETDSDNIKANPRAQACGTIIESHVDKGAGPVATLLVQNGTLRTGDPLRQGEYNIGKVRALYDYKGEKIEAAMPATPAQIIGLKYQPQVGDIIEAGEGARAKRKKSPGSAAVSSAAETGESDAQTAQSVNLIIKSDVLGSAEAIEESLQKINTKDIRAHIIHKGLGNIADGDIKRAEASDALIIGFNVKVPPVIEELARERGVEIKLYSIIYDLINDVKERMQGSIRSVVERQDLGKLKVLAVFRSDKDSQIIGGKVLEGRIEPDSEAEVLRDKEIVAQGRIVRLQSGKQDVNSAEQDSECGAQFEGPPDIAEGDILQVYRNREVTAAL